MLLSPWARERFSPEDYDSRHEIVLQDARETWWKQGYEEGKAAGLQAVPYNGPLDSAPSARTRQKAREGHC
jgi:hypothetical protein